MKSRKYVGVENPFKEPLRKLHFRRKHDKNADPEAPTAASSIAAEEMVAGAGPRSESPETTETQIPEEEEAETPSMSFPLTIGLLVVVTVVSLAALPFYFQHLRNV